MPAGRPPNPLTPDVSLAHAVGAEIRSLREARGLTLEALGLRVGYTPQHLSAAEHAKPSLSFEFLVAIDAALGSRLVDRHDALAGERARNRSSSCGAAIRCPQEVDDVKRRAFLGLGLAVVLLGPEAAARADADDWERIAQAWSYEVSTAEDAQALLPGLAADLRRSPPSRTAALLNSYVAAIAISGGDPARARHAWRRARGALAQAADPQLAAYVGGKQAVQGLYGAYTPAQVIILADDALGATGQPCTGRMSALCGKGQALAMLKRLREARECYGVLEREFERLPRDVIREKLSALGFAEERMHNSRSFAGMFIGGGEPAREEALRLYAAADWRGAAQVRLHRAAADHDPAYAEEVLSGLSDVQRDDRRVRLIAQRAVAR